MRLWWCPQSESGWELAGFTSTKPVVSLHCTNILARRSDTYWLQHATPGTTGRRYGTCYRTSEAGYCLLQQWHLWFRHGRGLRGQWYCFYVSFLPNMFPAIMLTCHSGASGSIFGIIALTLLDLLYTWQTRRKPLRDLLFIILDICISFVLGLLPGLDNFSHIGGFLMGLVLGICLLRSPAPLRKRLGSVDEGDKTVMGAGALSSHSDPDLALQAEARARTSVQAVPNNQNVLTRPSSYAMFTSPRKFFTGRKPLWWAWWLLRVGALVGVIVAFIALLQSFYIHHDTQCPSCKYLSCLPVSNWCEIGDLTFNDKNAGN